MHGMCHRVPTFAVALVLVVALGACSGDGGDDGARTAPTPASASTVERTPTSAAETTTPAAAAAAAAEIVLRGDGLGVAALGAAPDDAIAAVSAALGAPTRDTGWEPSSSEYGTCPGEQIRAVEWDSLVLLFTDGDTAYGTGQHLFTWRITGAPPALGTAAGLGYQATVADAEELYPGAVERTEADEPFPGFLTIAADGGSITAYLDGDVITNLEAGTPCSE